MAKGREGKDSWAIVDTLMQFSWKRCVIVDTIKADASQDIESLREAVEGVERLGP